MGITPWRTLHVEVNEDGTVGGSHQALFDLVCGLDRSLFSPVVLFYQQNRFVQRFRAAGVETHVFDAQRARERNGMSTRGTLTKGVRMISAVLRRFSFIRKHRIELLHLNNSPFAGTEDWLPAGRMARIPCVAALMGPVGDEGLARRWLARRFDCYLPISDLVAESVQRLGVPVARIRRIYLGVDIEGIRGSITRAPDDVRAELGAPPGSILVAMVGNVREWKGQHVVLEALRGLRPEELQQLRVVFVGAMSEGDLPYYAELQRRIGDWGLSHVARFLGARTDVPDLLNAADIALHASIKPEPFGLVVVEAMAMGTPVIAANTGGPAEVLTRGSGLTFDPTRPSELTAALRRLAWDPALRQQQAARASERVQEFSVAQNVQETQSAFLEALAGRNRP